MEPSVAERVEAGFAVLDEIAPGWTEKIERPINVFNPNDCPCGQVFGNFNTATFAGPLLGIVRFDNVMDLGFYARDPEDRIAVNAEWHSRIEERLEEQERIVDELIEAGEAHRLAFDNTGALVVVS